MTNRQPAVAWTQRRALPMVRVEPEGNRVNASSPYAAAGLSVDLAGTCARRHGAATRPAAGRTAGGRPTTPRPAPGWTATAAAASATPTATASATPTAAATSQATDAPAVRRASSPTTARLGWATLGAGALALEWLPLGVDPRPLGAVMVAAAPSAPAAVLSHGIWRRKSLSAPRGGEGILLRRRNM